MPAVSASDRPVAAGLVERATDVRQPRPQLVGLACGSPYQAPFHWSANRATSDSMRGCFPAMRIGGPPGRIGRGEFGVLGAVVAALEGHGSPRRSGARISRPSSNRPTRWSKG